MCIGESRKPIEVAFDPLELPARQEQESPGRQNPGLFFRGISRYLPRQQRLNHGWLLAVGAGCSSAKSAAFSSAAASSLAFSGLSFCSGY